MDIISGKIKSAQKVVIYGPEGIGKSTLAAQFPNPLFIDTEGSTKHMDVRRLKKPTSWTYLLQQVKDVKSNPGVCKTLVIDTADWAEQLCIQHICAKASVDGIEGWGYGRGYVYLGEEFGRFLNALEEVIDKGIHVVLTAHAKMRKFEQPDEIGAYDRWEMKLQKNTAPLVKEWADMVLFASYKTQVVNVDNQGAQKGKNKAQGGKRIMYTSHHACWDAKNRHGLPDEIPLDYTAIAHCLEDSGEAAVTTQTTPVSEPVQPIQKDEPVTKDNPSPVTDSTPSPEPDPVPEPPDKNTSPNLPQALVDLMTTNNVTEADIQEAVAQKGYYPKDTLIENYAPDFIQGVLIAAWPQVLQIINDLKELPFTI